jgi:hypothetical protein
MPALVLHLTMAKDALAAGRDVPELGLAATAQQPSFLLGAILPDLPYHASFARQVLRHLRGHAYLSSEWGDLFHYRATGRLALAMLAHVLRSHLGEQERAQVVAMAAGYLSHLAVDATLHPFIQQLVKRHLRPGQPADALHARLERYQSLLFHRDRLGLDLAGSPWPRRMIGEVAGVGLLRCELPAAVWAAFRIACLQSHGRAPGRAEVRDWLWGVAAYGQLMSSPAGRCERLRGDLARLRAEFYQGEGVDLCSPLQTAIELTLEHWKAASEVLRAQHLTAAARQLFLQRVPDLDLATGC